LSLLGEPKKGISKKTKSFLKRKPNGKKQKGE